MAKATAVIPFNSMLSGSFALEQVEYQDVDPGGFEQWLIDNNLEVTGASIFLAYHQFISGCDLDGNIDTELRVHLSDIATPYTLRLSYGTLGAGSLQTEVRTEYLGFELDTEASVDFGTITAASWNGDVCDGDGNVIAAPEAPALSGNTATVSTEVYGVLECTVSESYYAHSVHLEPRDMTAWQEAREDFIVDELYASTAMLFCQGKIELHDLELPDNIGGCDGGSSGMTTPDPGEVITYTVMIGDIFDYCSGNPVDNPSVYIDGVLVTGESVELESGEHTVRVTAIGYTDTDADDLDANDTFTLP